MDIKPVLKEGLLTICSFVKYHLSVLWMPILELAGGVVITWTDCQVKSKQQTPKKPRKRPYWICSTIAAEGDSARFQCAARKIKGTTGHYNSMLQVIWIQILIHVRNLSWNLKQRSKNYIRLMSHKIRRWSLAVVNFVITKRFARNLYYTSNFGECSFHVCSTITAKTKRSNLIELNFFVKIKISY